jgi:hypothetical protein
MADKEHIKGRRGLVFSWVFGVILILGSFGAISSLELISGLVMLIMGSVFIPPLNKFISKKIKFDLSSKWIKVVIVIVGIIIISIFTDVEETTPATEEILTPQETSTQPTTQEEPKEIVTTPKPSPPTVTEPEYDLEMTRGELFNTFSKLSDIQQDEKNKELKGKRIKTLIYASDIDKASLSSQYIVKEMYEYPYNLIAYAKAFFPAEEKDNLLSVNIGETIIFSGEFVSYRKGGVTSGTIEFTKSKFIGIEE